MNWKTHVTAALDGEHPVLGRSIALALQVLIILSGISIGVETLPNVPPQMDVYFEYEEAVIVGIFTVEYILRVVAAERPLAYVTSVLGIIDLLAVLPYYLSLGLDLRSIWTFRLLRMLQLLKYARYSAAANRIGRALRGCFEELVVFAFVAVLLIYLCSIFIHYFEHDAQPEAFASVFHAMWWAAITLTTVGYGDIYPITPGGRIFTVAILIVALGIIAVPTGIISTALARLRDSDENT